MTVDKNKIIKWVQDYFEQNGPTSKAIIGISGGKDSTVAAALCVAALGPDRVIGVRMPEHFQYDEMDAYRVCEHLNIGSYRLDIGDACDAIYSELQATEVNNWDSSIVKTNVPARIRMTTLYAVAGALGGRVCCTSNGSEAYVGYSTKWGDGVGDFAPLRNMTVAEVIDLGRQLGMPEDLLIKSPADGLSGKTDEENMGLTYDDIDTVYKSEGNLESMDTYLEILKRHNLNKHKTEPIPMYPNK
jgi:NAD+ synthase